MSLEKAASIDEVRESVHAFANALRQADPRVKFAISDPDYFVYDTSLDAFAPAKWAAFRNMSVAKYDDAKREQREDNIPLFNGGITRDHLAQLCGRQFVTSSELATRLRTALARAFGEDAVAGRGFTDQKFLELPSDKLPAFWWVNQGGSYEEAQAAGAIWAGTRDQGGSRPFHWENVSKVSVGDIAFACEPPQLRAVLVATSQGHQATTEELESIGRRGSDSWFAKMKYYPLKNPLAVERVSENIRSMNLEKGPINKKGTGNQGYLFSLTKEAARAIADVIDPAERPPELVQALGWSATSAKRRFWKFAPGDNARLWRDLSSNGIIAVGYQEVPDLQAVKTKEELEAAVRRAYPDRTKGKIDFRVRELWALLHEIKPGDIIVANNGLSEIVGRGEVSGSYRYESDRSEYPHTIPVRWFDTTPRSVGDQGGGWQRTILELTEKQYLKLFPGGSDGSSPAVAGDSTLSVYDAIAKRNLRFPVELVTTYLLSLKTKPFVILSGISGTGKTKLAQAIAEIYGTETIAVETQELSDPEKLDTDEFGPYELQPYTFKYRRIIIPRSFEPLLELPSLGDRKVELRHKGKSVEARLNNRMHEGHALNSLFLSKEFVDFLARDLKAGDLVSFRVEDGPSEVQIITIRKLEARHEIRTEQLRRYEFISVRPDWLDGKEALGFYNILTESYVSRPLLHLLLRAHRDRTKPHFVILDEMNLARVEHYFADILSATESRMITNGKIQQESLHLHDAPQCLPLHEPEGWTRPASCANCRATREEVSRCPLSFDGVQLVPPKLEVPANVYLTGTVNIDETTHMFSPKVLDRANVIEFNRVDLVDGVQIETTFKLGDRPFSLSASRPATLEDFQKAHPDVRRALIDLQQLLEPFNLHFGYRVANEIALFTHHAIQNIGPNAVSAALDLQVLQKILPKLHGTKQKLLQPLRQLLLFTVIGSQDDLPKPEEATWQKIVGAALERQPVPLPIGPTTPVFPRSCRKLARMVDTLRSQGFVSFIE